MPWTARAACSALSRTIYLIQNRERVVSKDDLTAAIWDGRAVSDSALTTRINALRRVIGDSGKQQRRIKTLSRKGFRFVGEVREEAELPTSAGRHLSSETAPAALVLPEKPSIAVLPFAVMAHMGARALAPFMEALRIAGLPGSPVGTREAHEI